LNPNKLVDPLITALLQRALAVSGSPTGAAPSLEDTGVYVGGEVTLGVIEGLRDLGIKRFAVDCAEIRPLQLALVKAASTS
jgi:hypothetical protein